MFALITAGLSLRTIAKQLNRSHSSLSRELRRNKTGKGKLSREFLNFKYLPCKANVKAIKRGAKQRTKAPLKETLIWLYVREHLRKPFYWTPEEISGRLSIEYPGKSICVESIYQYIYSKSAKRYKLWELLPNHRKKRMKKGGRKVHSASKIPDATSIELRPETVALRARIGDWETDNMIGRQTDKIALSVTVERVTKLTLLSLTRKSADSKSRALIAKLSQFPPHIRLTLTTDNGSENTYHQIISKRLGLAVFFCHPYSSWEKGTVENTNGRIRRFIRKGISLDNLTQEQITRLEFQLNSTPRKSLGYLTPYEKMSQVLV